MAKRENPMAVRSKAALASALLRLMMAKSFYSISISDITDAAGLSRQTFYTNFSKREDIIDYLLSGLFDRLAARMTETGLHPENIIVDYLLYWDTNRKLISLLFEQNLGYMFQAKNREFFIDGTSLGDEMFCADPWQIPYLRASLAGVAYELLWMWLRSDRGLSVDVLIAMAENLVSGRMFEKPPVHTSSV